MEGGVAGIENRLTPLNREEKNICPDSAELSVIT